MASPGPAFGIVEVCSAGASERAMIALPRVATRRSQRGEDGMIEGLDHFNLSPADLERSRRFYKEVLRLVDGDRPMFQQPGAWLYAGTRPIVHLSVRDAG